MNIKEVAIELNGCEYGEEVSPAYNSFLKDLGIVVVFGASDDLTEFRGAIHDERGGYDGGDIFLHNEGLLTNDCENDECPHFQTTKDKTQYITAVWCAEDDISWTFETALPHETFNVMEESEIYCRGIVFELSSLSDPT